VRYSKKSSQIALLTKFYPVGAKEPLENGLCLVTTHLKAKFGCEHQRLAQGQKLLREIEKFNNKNLPIVICGDFNDEPGSFVHNLIVKKELTEKGKKFAHSLNLKSGYGDDSLFTTYKKRETEMCRTIDYIWYSEKLKCTHYLDIPSKQELPQRLPASYYPSDHLAISCIFEVL